MTLWYREKIPILEDSQILKDDIYTLLKWKMFEIVEANCIWNLGSFIFVESSLIKATTG